MNSPRKIEPTANAEALLKEFALAEAQLQQAKEAFNPLRKQVLALVPKEIGEFEVEAGNWRLSIEYPDGVSWDSDELAAYYGTDAPMYVKRSLSINETDYARLPTEEREAICKARSPKVGTPKISVEVIR